MRLINLAMPFYFLRPLWAHNTTEKPGTSAEAIDFMQQF